MADKSEKKRVSRTESAYANFFGRKDISASEMSLLQALAFCENHETRKCFPSIRYIASLSHLSEKTIASAKKSLRDKNIISWKNCYHDGKQTSDLYSFLFKDLSFRQLIENSNHGWEYYDGLTGEKIAPETPDSTPKNAEVPPAKSQGVGGKIAGVPPANLQEGGSKIAEAPPVKLPPSPPQNGGTNLKENQKENPKLNPKPNPVVRGAGEAPRSGLVMNMGNAFDSAVGSIASQLANAPEPEIESKAIEDGTPCLHDLMAVINVPDTEPNREACLVRLKQITLPDAEELLATLKSQKKQNDLPSPLNNPIAYLQYRLNEVIKARNKK